MMCGDHCHIYSHNPPMCEECSVVCVYGGGGLVPIFISMYVMGQEQRKIKEHL